MVQEASGPQLLVVDDEPELRSLLVEYFARHGFAVEAVGRRRRGPRRAGAAPAGAGHPRHQHAGRERPVAGALDARGASAGRPGDAHDRERHRRPRRRPRARCRRLRAQAVRDARAAGAGAGGAAPRRDDRGRGGRRRHRPSAAAGEPPGRLRRLPARPRRAPPARRRLRATSTSAPPSSTCWRCSPAIRTGRSTATRSWSRRTTAAGTCSTARSTSGSCGSAQDREEPGQAGADQDRAQRRLRVRARRRPLTGPPNGRAAPDHLARAHPLVRRAGGDARRAARRGAARQHHLAPGG